MSVEKDSVGSLLVTGVGSANGLGAAIARRFAREGYAVVIAGRSKEKLEITLAEIQAIQPQSKMVVGDVTKSADMRH
ncbi:MAG: SDR family NAD(P)-dependent oxidoreductase, partial [Betaproteobacteria bacterium]